MNPGDDYERIKSIGQGGFGEVFLMKRKSDGELFAMKHVKNATPEER